MRNTYAILIGGALLAACAQAEPPAPMPATAAQQPAPRVQPAALAAIVDSEPDVTQQVNDILVRVGKGSLAAEPLTENARTAMTPANVMPMSAKLRACGASLALQLLDRKTKGEERQYLYRAPCGGNPLLVEINFGKGDRISHLAVRPEKVR